MKAISVASEGASLIITASKELRAVPIGDMRVVAGSDRSGEWADIDIFFQLVDGEFTGVQLRDGGWAIVRHDDQGWSAGRSPTAAWAVDPGSLAHLLERGDIELLRVTPSFCFERVERWSYREELKRLARAADYAPDDFAATHWGLKVASLETVAWVAMRAAAKLEHGDGGAEAEAKEVQAAVAFESSMASFALAVLPRDAGLRAVGRALHLAALQGRRDDPGLQVAVEQAINEAYVVEGEDGPLAFIARNDSEGFWEVFFARNEDHARRKAGLRSSEPRSSEPELKRVPNWDRFAGSGVPDSAWMAAGYSVECANCGHRVNESGCEEFHDADEDDGPLDAAARMPVTERTSVYCRASCAREAAQADELRPHAC